MEVLKVTAKATDHHLPKGTKLIALTDNSGRETLVDFEDDAGPKSKTSQRLNSGRNLLKVPDRCTSFSIVGPEEFNIGVDYVQGTDEEGGDRLENLEARVAALEAVVAQQIKNHDDQKEMAKAKHADLDHSTKGHAARKK